MEARGIASALHDPVPRRREEERPEREEQCEQGAQLQRSLRGNELLVALLEERPILEAEQHLRSQDQDAGFVQGVLHLAVQGHTEMCGARLQSQTGGRSSGRKEGCVSRLSARATSASSSPARQSLTGSQMQQIAMVWQLYLLTNSPLSLGLLGAFRVTPILLL